ncbi:hypothetical protein ACP70R_013567 [Stipagrostis hirtigluma subsp. patula]
MAEKIIEEAGSSEIVSPKSLQSSVQPELDEDHHNNLQKTESVDSEASVQQELPVSLMSTDNKSNLQEISVEQKVPLGDSVTLSPKADMLSTSEVRDGLPLSCSEAYESKEDQDESDNFEASIHQELPMQLISTDNKSNLQEISVEQKVLIGDSVTVSPKADSSELLSTNEVPDGLPLSCSEAYESKEAQNENDNFEALVSLMSTDNKSYLQEISVEQKLPIGGSVALSPKADNSELLPTTKVPDCFLSSSKEAYESHEAQDESANVKAPTLQERSTTLISTGNNSNLQEISVEQRVPIGDFVTLSPKADTSELLSNTEVPDGFPSPSIESCGSKEVQDDAITMEASKANAFAVSQSVFRFREGVQHAAAASVTDSNKVPCETTPAILRKVEQDRPLVVHSLHKRQMSLRDTRQKVPASVSRSVSGNFSRTDKSIVDTTTHIESVKAAASKFGGSIIWKARRTQPAQETVHVTLQLDKVKSEISECKRQVEDTEAAKVSVLNELERTKKLIEELKHVLVRQQAEEVDAKEDLQFFQFIIQETAEGVTSDDSAVVKEKLKTIQERYNAVVAKLMFVKDESRRVQEDYDSLLLERNTSIRKAQAAFTMSKEAERQELDLTVELNQLKGALDLAHGICHDAKERKRGTSMARDEDCLTWENDLKQVEEELNQFNENLSSIEELKLKLATSSSLLLKLNDELACLEANLIEQAQDQESATHEFPSRNEIEEHRKNIAKAADEICALKVTAASIKSELNKEKAALASMQQKEAMASITVSSLKLEIKMSQQELEAVQAKVKECQDRMVELPKVVQDAACEAENAKSMATNAQEKLRNTKDELEQAKAALSTMALRLQAVLTDIEAAKASERLALNALRAWEGTNLAVNIEQEVSSKTITLDFYEYASLIEKSRRADELVRERTAAAVAQVEAAKESESRTISRLNEVYKTLEERKRALLAATEQAERATEGKLAMEQELRKWREENRKRREAGEVSKSEAKLNAAEIVVERRGDTKGTLKEDSCASVHPVSDVSGRSSPNDLAVHAKAKKVKKLPFFPRVIMFLARRRLKAAK